MARCCGSAGTCACRIIEGRHVDVTGMGTSQDPFVIATTTDLSVENSSVFDLGLSGLGTLDSPWRLSVAFADTASINDLPDVDAPLPSNGQVLTYDAALGMWVSAAPVTASPGAVLTDTSLSGDGSAGAPLEVQEDPARLLGTTATGLGLTDEGINSTIRKFADNTARAAAAPAPTLNTLSVLETSPGRVDYWDGTAWVPYTGIIGLDIQPGELLELSGPYAFGPVVQSVVQLDFVTDVDGSFEILGVDDLTEYAGVLSCNVQPTGATPFVAMVVPDATTIRGVAYRIDDGTPFAGFNLTATATSVLY